MLPRLKVSWIALSFHKDLRGSRYSTGYGMPWLNIGGFSKREMWAWTHTRLFKKKIPPQPPHSNDLLTQFAGFSNESCISCIDSNNDCIADTTFPKMTTRNASRSAAENPDAWISRICLSTVDLPESPAPIIARSLSFHMIVARSNILTEQQDLDLAVQSFLVAFDLLVYCFAFVAVDISHSVFSGHNIDTRRS